MKFKNSDTIKDQRMSIVWVQHKGKIYHGISYCSDEDEWSEYSGCTFAELKAMRKALKSELKEEKIKLQECENFVTCIEQYKNFNKEDGTAKAMYRQLNRRKRTIARLKASIKNIDEVIKSRIDALKNIQQKKVKND